MLKEERFAKIIDYLRANNTATVSELAKLNKVSMDTVRRDLEELEEYGALDRVHGGAVWRRESLLQHVYEMRTTINAEAKRHLATLVSEILDDGQTVLINSGSTTVEIAKYIASHYKRLTIITNDIDIVKVLAHKDTFKIIMLGGFVEKSENATYGELCENEVEKYSADVGIFAVNSISEERGVRDFRIKQIEAYQKMIDISKKVVIATDSSKFGKNSFMPLCDLNQVDYILSDEGLPPEEIVKFERLGINVLTPHRV